jgi:hypothetical protein
MAEGNTTYGQKRSHRKQCNITYVGEISGSYGNKMIVFWDIAPRSLAEI